MQNPLKRYRSVDAVTEEAFDFVKRPGESLTLEEIVFQALGAASMCWEFPERAGIFDSISAEKIGRKLIEEMAKLE